MWVTLAFASSVAAACGERKTSQPKPPVISKPAEPAVVPPPSKDRGTRPVFEFLFLWHEELDWLSEDELKEDTKFHETDGWMRVELRTLPKTLNELGSQGWEMLVWDGERILLRRTKSSLGGDYAAVEYHAIAHRIYPRGRDMQFMVDQGAFEAGGWSLIDVSKGNLRTTVNELATKGWDVAAWKGNYLILRRAK
jgi:hypothetical protein